MSKKSRANKLVDSVNQLVGKDEPVSTVAEVSKLDSEKAKAETDNKARSGKGTRVRVGQTRGKNPQVISWEAFDESQPETLPTSLQEFVTLTGVKEEKDLVGLVITGYNAEQYSSASDPIAEYVNPVWSTEVQAQFRAAVRSFAKATGKEIEEVANMLRPAIDAKHNG